MRVSGLIHLEIMKMQKCSNQSFIHTHSQNLMERSLQQVKMYPPSRMNMKKSCVLILPLHLFIYLADAYIQSNLQIRTMVVKLTI